MVLLAAPLWPWEPPSSSERPGSLCAPPDGWEGRAAAVQAGRAAPAGSCCRGSDARRALVSTGPAGREPLCRTCCWSCTWRTKPPQHGHRRGPVRPVMPYLNSSWDSERSTEQFTDHSRRSPTEPPELRGRGVRRDNGAAERCCHAWWGFSGRARSGTTSWQAAGVSWGVYEEAVPTACYAGAYNNDTAVSDGPYKIGHTTRLSRSPGSTTTPASARKLQPFTGMNPAALPAVSLRHS